MVLFYDIRTTVTRVLSGVCVLQRTRYSGKLTAGLQEAGSRD